MELVFLLVPDTHCILNYLLSNFLFTDDNIIGGFGGGIIEWLTNNGESMHEYGYHPSLRQSTRFFDEFLWPKIKDEVETHYTKINK